MDVCDSGILCAVHTSEKSQSGKVGTSKYPEGNCGDKFQVVNGARVPV